MTIIPDEKDWTWVLEGPCPECGHDTRSVGVDLAPQRVTDAASRMATVLDRPDVAVRARPDRWSDLEYVCHVRDVFRRFDGRIALMLAEQDPLFENWDQDATAVEDDYASQDPVAVRAELVDAADALVTRIQGLDTSDLARSGRRSDGAAFTVDSLVRYMVHDPIHHLWDVDA